MLAFLTLLGLTGCLAAMAASDAFSRTITLKNNNPLIYYHGRWDSTPGTWWAGSGLKLNVLNLESLTLNLGPHTTAPFAAIGVSVDGSDYVTVNGSTGAIPIPLPKKRSLKPIVVRINVEGWQDNRIDLESITLNSDAVLLPYKPSRITFQFIGDSLSAGQFLPLGVNQAWPFLTAEAFKAEVRVNAQPGATLTDIESYGNVHGVSFQFFKTEDTGFYYTSDHNFTTNWNFAKDQPAPTHVVIHIGANDASQSVSNDQFIQVYTDFLVRLRSLYPHQPIFVFTPWGWPHENETDYYYDGVYQQIVDARKAKGDKNIFIVDTTGWVAYADVFPDNTHPNVEGHAKIATEFVSWLKRWGLSSP